MRFETEKDREEEREIISYLQSKYPSYRFIQAAPLLPFDCYCLRRNSDRDLTIHSIIEFKKRSHPSTKYDSLMLSLKKLKRLWCFSKTFAGLEEWKRERSKLTEISVRLFVKFTDKLMFADIGERSKDTFEMKWGGRVDRGAATDMEMLAHIPMTSFKGV